MKVIDSDDYGASGIKTFFFPGGEPHAQLPEDKFGDALLFLKARTWNDFGLALCVMDALVQQHDQVWCFAPYLPGARQDRTDKRTPLTKVMLTEMLGNVCHRLYTFDIHSHTKLNTHIEHNFMPSDIYQEAWKMDGWIICPDHGALLRARDLARVALNNPNNIIYCDKQRDFDTGKFTGFEMQPLKEKGVYLVVDDICDGGGTFNLLAEAFDKDPLAANSMLSLYVSHGIFSKGVENISERYDAIFTTDSWCRKPDRQATTMNRQRRLDVLSLKPLIDKILEDAE